MVHGKRRARGRRGPRARHAGRSGARAGRSPALHFGPGESGGSRAGVPWPAATGARGGRAWRCAEPARRPPSVPRPSLPPRAPGGARPPPAPAAPGPPCPRPAPPHGRPAGGGRAGSCSARRPAEVKARLPRDALLQPRGPASGKPRPPPPASPGVSEGAVPCARRWEPSLRGWHCAAPVSGFCFFLFGRYFLGGGGGRIRWARLEVPDASCALGPCRGSPRAQPGLAAGPGGAGARGLPPAAMRPAAGRARSGARGLRGDHSVPPRTPAREGAGARRGSLARSARGPGARPAPPLRPKGPLPAPGSEEPRRERAPKVPDQQQNRVGLGVEH